jgi:hypothetical protein
MFVQKITGCAAAVAVASIVSMCPSQAAMSPLVHYGTPNLHHVDCAVGFHIGPLGTCIVGVENGPPPDRVIERRSADEGCESKSVKRTDSDGNSETKTKTNCN